MFYISDEIIIVNHILISEFHVKIIWIVCTHTYKQLHLIIQFIRCYIVFIT